MNIKSDERMTRFSVDATVSVFRIIDYSPDANICESKIKNVQANIF